MNILSIPIAVMVGITVYVGISHLLIHAKIRQSLTDYTFAANCFAMAAYQVMCIGLYNSSSLEDGVFWQRCQLVAISATAIAFLVFIHAYLSVRLSKIAFGFIIVYAASAVLQFVDRSDCTWIVSAPMIKTISLPFGNSVSFHESTPGMAVGAVYVVGIIMFLYIFAMAVAHQRRHGGSRAKLLIFAIMIYYIGSLNDAFFSMGYTNSIYFVEYTFLGIVFLMTGSLNAELAEASTIRRSLQESEEIFKGIVELTPYPIAIIGNEERFEYLNPRFIDLFGYTVEDIKTTEDWFHLAYPDPGYRAMSHRLWKAGEAGHERVIIGKKEFNVKCKDGMIRQVVFRILSIPTGKRFVIFDDVTESKRIEQELRESEERYRLIYDNASEVIFLLDRNFHITYISPYSHRILGYRPEELMGKTVGESAIIAPDSLINLGDTINKIVAGEAVASLQFSFITKDGRIKFGDMSITPLMRDGAFYGMVGFVHDITEQKAAQDTIAMRDRMLNAVTQAANHLLRSRNLDAAIEGMLGTLGNATQLSRIIIYRNVLGEEREQLLRRRYSWRSSKPGDPSPDDLDGIHLEKISRWRKILSGDEIIHGLADHFPADEKKLLASQRILSVVLVPIFLSEQWWGFIEFDDCINPKEWSPVEIEVLKSAANIIGSSLQRTRSEEEILKASKIESLGVFAGGIAHDFNNLLTAVIGNISIARLQLPVGSEIQNILIDAERASQRTRELTQQLLTFSKGGMPIKQTSSIKSLLIDTAQFVLSGAHFQREYNIPEELWNARIDRGQISQVIHNIILNARQSMKDRGILSISAENTVIGRETVGDLEPGRYVKIIIRDQGEGIPPKNLQNIFDPYFTTKKEGTGLGLSISYSIVKKHGGLIAVHSELGKGSRFDIYLPATSDILEPQEGSGIAPARQHGKALVMDDEEGVLKVAERMLAKLGYSVTCVRDGTAAVEAYERSVGEGSPYNVVIMDLTVPGGMGGLEANRLLQERYPGARVIVSSGYSNNPVMAEHYSHGFAGVIVKPYRFEELAEAIHRCAAGPASN